MTDIKQQEYWNSRWKEGKTGWDLGMPSPPILHLINTLQPKKSSRILIPGCGNAWEAAWLAEQGFQHITLVDISPELCRILEQRFATTPAVHIHCADFFYLEETYDLILEQTFFCAILPELRNAYVAKMADLLSAEGILAGVLFDTNFPFEGPPFGGHGEEYRPLFEHHFSDVRIEPCTHSAAPRAGNECLLQCRNNQP